MGFLNWLMGRTPRAIDPVPDFDVTVGNIRLNRDTLDPAVYAEIKRQLATTGVVDLTVTVPDDDPPEVADMFDPVQPPHPESEPVEPVFCTIDYTDVAGRASRRRITARSVQRRGDATLIVALCHERRALRHFRLDRISRVVTHDGEVFSADVFAKDILGIDIKNTQTGTAFRPRKTEVPRPTSFARYTSPQVLILTAAANADDHLHAEEAEQIHRFLEREAPRLLKSGHIHAAPSVENLDVIGRRIIRLRPTQDDIAEALIEMRSRPADQITRLCDWMPKVIAADGALHASEEDFAREFHRFFDMDASEALAEIDRLLTGG